MILEYKLNRTSSGTVTTPPWIERGGHFFDPSTKTYIGFSPSSPNREYKIPDSVVALSLDQLKTRVRALSMTENTIEMTDAEKGSIVDSVVSLMDFE